MATKSGNDSNDQVQENTAASEPEPGGVSDKERDDVLREFHETGRVRQGFVVNYSWTDVVRKAS